MWDLLDDLPYFVKAALGPHLCVECIRLLQQGRPSVVRQHRSVEGCSLLCEVLFLVVRPIVLVHPVIETRLEDAAVIHAVEVLLHLSLAFYVCCTLHSQQIVTASPVLNLALHQVCPELMGYSLA